MMEQHPGMDPNYGAHMSSGAPHGHSSMPPPGYPSGGAAQPHTGQQGGAYPPQKPSGPLSITQLKFLSSQIKAYRCLARNTAIPDQIRSVILSHASNLGVSTPPRTSSPAAPGTQPPPGSSTAPPTAPSGSASPAPSQSADATQKPPSSGDSQTSSPSTKPEDTKGDKPAAAAGTQPGTTPAKPQTQIRQAKLAPPVKPRGLDPDLVLKERESRYGISHNATEFGLPFNF